MHADTDTKDITLGEYLHQRDVWLAAGGLVRINDMVPGHRKSAARWLIKNCGHLFQHWTMETSLDSEEHPGLETVIQWVDTRPSQWIKRTPLFLELVAGLDAVAALDVG